MEILNIVNKIRNVIQNIRFGKKIGGLWTQEKNQDV